MSPSQSPKYQWISEAIESLIRTGSKIPSARKVARDFEVSLVTATRALQVLNDKGLIRTVERSRSSLATNTQEANSGQASIQRWGLYLRSTPGPWMRASIAVLVDGFETVCSQEGSTLETEGFEFERWDSLEPAAIEDRVKRMVDSGMDGLFFVPSRHCPLAAKWDELFLEACRTEKLPLILIERNLRGTNRPLEHDLLASDDFDGGFQSASHLIAEHCRRLGFVNGSPTSSHEARLAGVLVAAQQGFPGDTRSKPIPVQILYQKGELPTKDAFEDLVDRIIEQKLDGVICYQDYTTIGLIVELLRRRVRVPDDVALTGFDNLPIGNSFALGVTTYASSGLTLATSAFRFMRYRIEHPDHPPLKVVVPGTLIIRESSDRSSKLVDTVKL